MPEAIARVSGIDKRFPGVQALSDVSLDVQVGEILGLAGENGSGKSTLMKVLAGRYQPDAGTVEFEGDRVRFASPADALSAGIALIAQEVLVYPDLTVAENLLAGSLPRGFGRRIDWRAANAEARRILDDLEIEARPDALLGTLALHQQHMVSIAKMVRREPKVLILDEPTSSLTEAQVEQLFTVLRRVRDNGTAVVYITHRLREYFELCDRVVVLRDGGVVSESAISDLDEADLVRSMVGRQLESLFSREAAARERGGRGETVLAVRGLTTRKLRGISFDLAAGEVVGVAGQAGAGRSSLARSLFGLHPYSGTVEVGGKEVALKSVQAAISAGIGYVPEDRKGAGLVLSCSVGENLTMPSWHRVSKVGIRDIGEERALADAAVERLQIRTPSTETITSSLSGGNQQKIVIAKWMACRPRVLIMDEPTRGVDVGAKEEIYRLIDELANDGIAVLVCSSELLELLRLSDRILVMAAGRIVGEQNGNDATEESITSMAFHGLAREVAA